MPSERSHLVDIPIAVHGFLSKNHFSQLTDEQQCLLLSLRQQARRNKFPPNHTEYMASAGWRQKRDYYKSKWSLFCGGCSVEETLDGHHKNYDNFGYEGIAARFPLTFFALCVKIE